MSYSCNIQRIFYMLETEQNSLHSLLCHICRWFNKILDHFAGCIIEIFDSCCVLIINRNRLRMYPGFSMLKYLSTRLFIAKRICYRIEKLLQLSLNVDDFNLYNLSIFQAAIKIKNFVWILSKRVVVTARKCVYMIAGTFMVRYPEERPGIHALSL